MITPEIIDEKQKYQQLREIALAGGPLSDEEIKFVRDIAWESLQIRLRDPESMAVLQRLRDR